MVNEGYSEDAVLISLDGQVKGKTALKEYFGEHIPDLGGVKLKAINKLVETETAVFVEVTVTTGKYGDVTSYEAFVFRAAAASPMSPAESKAEYHFTALK